MYQSDVRGAPTSKEIRSGLGHPVIDSDFHTVEFGPLFEDYLAQYGGSSIVDRYRQSTGWEDDRWYKLTAEERRRYRVMRPPWWPIPAKRTKDLATISLPRLLHERLEECGTDFVVVHPNAAFFAIAIGIEDLRRPFVRAVNHYNADMFRPYSDRITPSAAIPLNSPEEGIEELNFAVSKLGLKAGLIPGSLMRKGEERSKSFIHGNDVPFWLDTFGLDSDLNYDLFWNEVVSLGVPLTTHAIGMGWTGRTSCSNFIYNHIGHFASGAEALCKSLFLSGVTARFPSLRIAFLEGGSLWAVSLYNELAGRWEQRNGATINNYNPSYVDGEELKHFFEAYADEEVLTRIHAEDFPYQSPFCYSRRSLLPPRQEELDEFASAEITKLTDVKDRFVPNFFFGAESFDVTVVHAFNKAVNPCGASLNAIWATDSGHFDSPDIAASLSKTWQLLERGLITQDDFSALVYENQVALYEGANAHFFDNTSVAPHRQASLSAANVEDADDEVRDKIHRQTSECHQ